MYSLHALYHNTTTLRQVTKYMFFNRCNKYSDTWLKWAKTLAVAYTMQNFLKDHESGIAKNMLIFFQLQMRPKIILFD